MSQDYVIGTFVREEKNRFLCTVNVEGTEEECYIPSSCRLENFLKLAGKEVLLRENLNKKARTRLSVYALRFKRNYMILRTSEANEMIINAIGSRRFSYLGDRRAFEKEKMVAGYKADVYLPCTKTVIEIKSIITTNDKATFPTVFSERALEQLQKIKKLLENGYKVIYIFVSLNPYVNEVSLSEEKTMVEYNRSFKECMDLGMICRAYSSELKNGFPVIKKEISVCL